MKVGCEGDQVATFPNELTRCTLVQCFCEERTGYSGDRAVLDVQRMESAARRIKWVGVFYRDVIHVLSYFGVRFCFRRFVHTHTASGMTMVPRSHCQLPERNIPTRCGAVI